MLRKLRSINYTALWVTGYFGDLSVVLVVDELQRQAVDKRCCKRPSRLRNWIVCTPPTFTCRTAPERITVHRPKPLLPSSGLFQESSILHILDTQRVCSVSLTTDSANLCHLLQEYHRIFSTYISGDTPPHVHMIWRSSLGRTGTQTGLLRSSHFWIFRLFSCLVCWGFGAGSIEQVEGRSLVRFLPADVRTFPPSPWILLQSKRLRNQYPKY